jgi:aspartokinase/homoserine dehydrogenase 1
MHILKFGGTSVGTPSSIRTLLDILKSQADNGKPFIVVCSAMGGVTNAILAMSKAALHKEEFIDGLRRIESMHQEAIREILKVENQNRALIATKVMINELEELLFGVRALGELSPGVQDKLVAFGELLSNQMIAEMIQQEVGPATFTDARSLVKTDNHFGNATVHVDATYEAIQSWHAGLKGAIAVVTGFIGSDDAGRTTTLGRGGSDYTAALFGAALGAEEVQIWTDVDGFMTADPRLVKSAYTLAELSYEEAMELSYFGAKVIYPPTMIPAIAKGIPITIKNTFNPSHTGTRIHSSPADDRGLIKGIASVGDVCLVNVQGSGLIGMKGFSARMFIALAEAGVNVMLITQASSEHSITMAVSPDDGNRSIEALNAAFALELQSGKMQAPELVKGLSILAVVGENMRHARGLSGKLFSTFGRAGINVVAIAQGSSELNISVVIDKKDLGRALNAVHDSLFLSPLKTVNVFCAGTGKIGAELLDQLYRASAYLASDHHLQINVLGIANSRKMLLSNNGGLDLSQWRKDLDEKGQKADTQGFLAAMAARNLPNTALVDNTSNRSLVSKYEWVFGHDLSVITCNKIGNSESFDQYVRFRDAARKSAVNYHYETTVGAALPIIRTLNDLRISGDEIIKIEAILSGTISFIFNNFKGDRSFGDVVREAQEKGYTEPDPRDDLNGLDFSRKMLILAREMGLSLEMTDVHIDPILPEACLNAPDIDTFYQELDKAAAHFEKLKNKAADEGKVIRYIGVLENKQIHIAIKLVDSSHAFYGLTGSDNIIAFTTERYLHDPLVVKGPGAGPQVTAAGVFADIVRVAQN